MTPSTTGLGKLVSQLVAINSINPSLVGAERADLDEVNRNAGIDLAVARQICGVGNGA